MYLISPKDKKGKVNDFKIGLTLDMRRRLNSYHLCYNRGYHIHGLILVKSSVNKQDGKEQKLELSRLLRAAESQMFEWLKKYNVKTSTRTRNSEWFRGKKKS